MKDIAVLSRFYSHRAEADDQRIASRDTAPTTAATTAAAAAAANVTRPTLRRRGHSCGDSCGACVERSMAPLVVSNRV